MSVKAVKTKKIVPVFERTNLQYDVKYDYETIGTENRTRRNSNWYGYFKSGYVFKPPN